MLSLSHLALLETSHYLFVIKVKQELDAMEAQGDISKVQQPTPWCTGMVVVKKNEGVRIFVNLKPPNRCAHREHHPLPKVDDILGQLTGATVF